VDHTLQLVPKGRWSGVKERRHELWSGLNGGGSPED